MPVPSAITDLSATPAYNSPPGSESPSSIDDYLRSHASFIAQLRDDKFDRSNILGTVSQSAGVPTGAIIESGSNSSGRYTRWADGTQICTGEVLMPAGAISTALSVTGTYAAVFSAQPQILHSTFTTGSGGGTQQSTGELNRNGVYLAVSTGSCVFRTYTYESAQSYSVYISYAAHGRWF